MPRSNRLILVVQARLRRASAKTTLDTYANPWPDSDESTRAAVDAASWRGWKTRLPAAPTKPKMVR